MGDSLAQRHAAALQFVRDLRSSLVEAQPPADISRAQADYDAAEERHSREQNPVKKRALCRELVRYGDRLEEVQEQYKESEAKRKEILDLFDSRLSKQLHWKLMHRASLDTGTDINPERDNDQATHQNCETTGEYVQTPEPARNQPPALSNDPVTHETNQSSGNLPQNTGVWNTIEPRSTSSRTHSATPLRGFSTDVDQQGGIEPTSQIAWSNKRLNNTSVSRPTKRQRQSVSSETGTERTITFGEVYKGGKARWKYRIVKIQGLYYIFGCEKHERHFCKENPLQAAMSHLKGKGHSTKKSNATQALRSLGTRVLDCTDVDVALNNKAADCYLAEQEKKRERRYASTNDLAQAPQTGGIYMAWWGDDDKGYWLQAFLVIPFSRQRGDGMDIQSVAESDLQVDIPACYKKNETTGWYEWAKGYEKHGKHANNREYPIMCLAGEIPYKVDWLPVCHFRKLDLEDEDLEDKDLIKAFIRKKGLGHGNEVGDDQISNLYRDNIAGDNDAPIPRGYRKSPVGVPYERAKAYKSWVTAKNQKSGRLGQNLPTREVKPEPTTVAREDEAAGRARQPSVRQRWPSARKGPPAMETLDDSGSE